MDDFTPTAYGPVFAPLLAERLAPLGPGTPNAALREQLEAMTSKAAFAHAGWFRDQFARAACAGVWLYHDYLEQSHQISQELHSAEGSYWHALMHRREPDPDNSKYWFRRVGEHRIFQALQEATTKLAQKVEGPEAASLAEQSAWDPMAFIDLCSRVSGTDSPVEMFCRRIQLAEWRLLFDFCYRQAVQV